ncbi:MAG: aminotransferase class V-fold PLP-dependent enzyme [Planctomycetes bacterium]|nr:aminotransferase class V-fold PLP-dependent enzyme [Planctomycetota bacterium]
MKSHWNLDPTVTFLNHGSFGACPRAVLDEQSRLRTQMEAEPLRFFVREAPPLLVAAREAFAKFLGCDQDELALVPNATTGVNAVVRSLDLRPGDEILVTDQEYNACRNIVDFVATRRGAVVIVAEIPFPIRGADLVRDRVMECVTKRTRLVLLDLVTSQTGLVMPAHELARELVARDIDVLIDGAHAPGMVPLDLSQWPGVFFTGNAHKWICAPKGAAFLRVPKSRQDEIRPPVISHGANAPTDQRTRFRHEFDWCGTSDPTAWLCIPKAIETMASMVPGGWPEVMKRNHDLVTRGRDLICDALEIAPPAPNDMLGSLASIPLPDRQDGVPRSAFDTDPIQDALLHDFGIEVPIMPWPGPQNRLLRISAQLYNELADYEDLAKALHGFT